MSAVLYLFLAHLGIGIAFTLLLVSKDAGVKFFRFNAGLAAALLAAALAFRPSAAGLASGFIATPAGEVALGVALACLTVYWLIAGRVWAWLRRPLALVATAAGVLAIREHALEAMRATGGIANIYLAFASLLSSAALLGGACTAMVLGHWYLVIPTLEVRHLQKMAGFHVATIAGRIAIVCAVLVLAASVPLLSGQSLRRYVSSIDGIFFWQRMLFGLAAPVVLSYMTWETAKIRSTQSATGILYVDFFTVVVGEVLACYLLLSTGLPL